MIEIIKKYIPDDFVIKELIDLSTITTESDLYKRLLPLKEDKFSDNIRIVFYHSHPLKYTFEDEPADILTKLQKMLVYLDIPNFFCLVITTYDLTNDMQQILRWTTNEHPIAFIKYDI